MQTTIERDRVWLTHRRRPPWTVCPQCGKPLQWRKTDVDGWVPCDDVPVMFLLDGKLRLVKRRDLIDGCALYNPQRHSGKIPAYAWMPHYYTCQVLAEERRAWAIKNRSVELC